MNYLLKSDDVLINLKGKQRTLITKNEMIRFIKNIQGKEYVNRSQAKKLTGLSYLGGIDSSSKIIKGVKYDYHTYIVYLYSWKNIFGNVCPNGQHCHEPCLNFSGRVKMDVGEMTILRARYFKTILYYVNREFFARWIHDEITSHYNKFGDKLMVRLNGTSDISPDTLLIDGSTIIASLPHIQFYDYTKVFKRLDLLDKYSNYHLTFSFDGYNIRECKIAQAMGVNVSIVIDGPMPSQYMGIPVFSMDDTDLRPLDEHKGCFGYLKLKETVNKQYDTKFIIKN